MVEIKTILTLCWIHHCSFSCWQEKLSINGNSTELEKVVLCTLNITSEWLSGSAWWTKSQSSTLNVSFISVDSSPPSYLHFYNSLNTCSHCTNLSDMWHPTFKNGTALCPVPEMASWSMFLGANRSPSWYKVFHAGTKAIQCSVNVAVNFLSQVIFVFLLFLVMVMSANKVETKEK